MTEEKNRCSFYETCSLFSGKLENEPERIAYVTSSYCFDDFEHCARYNVARALSIDKVPDSLLPQDIFDATKIIAKL